MNVTAQSAGLALALMFALGLLAGAGLVAVALARREASLSEWAARLQYREMFPATGPDGQDCPVTALPVPGSTPQNPRPPGRVALEVSTCSGASASSAARSASQGRQPSQSLC